MMQHDLDDVDLLGDRERGEDQGDDRGGDLRDHEKSSTVRAIGHCSPEQTECETGDRARQTDETEIERSQLRHAVADRELDHQPPEPVDLHPRSDVRDDEAEPEESEVAELERREG